MGDSEKLFIAVNANDHEQIKLLAAEDGADINAKNDQNFTILHIAAWKGHLESVKVILQSKGDPNVIGLGGSTPLHYAAKFGHYAVVLELLSNGAIHDPKTEKGNTPLDLCISRPIVNGWPIKDLLTKIKDLFALLTENGKPLPLHQELNQIKDMSIGKAVVNARNEQNQTLVQAAIIGGTMKMGHTVSLMRDENVFGILDAEVAGKNHEEKLVAARNTLQSRLEIFGPESPVTLTSEKCLHGLQNVGDNDLDTLNLYERIYEIEKRTLGENCIETISTNSVRGIMLHRLGRNEEAMPILESVYEKQSVAAKNLSSDGADNSMEQALEECVFVGSLDTLGMVYLELDMFDKAMETMQRIYEMYKLKYGPKHPKTFQVWSKIALIHTDQKQYSEARQIYHEVWTQWTAERGLGHCKTLRILFNIAQTYYIEGDTAKSETLLKEVLEDQIKHLGDDHSDTLGTQRSLVLNLLANGKVAEAKKVLNACRDKTSEKLGADHDNTRELATVANFMKSSFYY